jgi:peptidoglycan-associated lipoprotein
MLLGGVMMMAAAAPLLVAQDKGAAPERGTLEAAFTYNAAYSHVINGKSFWMQGGSAQLHGQFYRGLGVVADVTGMHASNINSTGVGLDLVAATFGPRYTWSHPHAKYALYAQALAGLGIGFNSVFPAPSGANTTGYNLALKMGGGMNVVLSPHLGLRAFEADWLRTALPNSATNVQNNVSLGAGIFFRFK